MEETTDTRSALHQVRGHWSRTLSDAQTPKAWAMITPRRSECETLQGLVQSFPGGQEHVGFEFMQGTIFPGVLDAECGFSLGVA
jgi:hypothetical protein